MLDWKRLQRMYEEDVAWREEFPSYAVALEEGLMEYWLYKEALDDLKRLAVLVCLAHLGYRLSEYALVALQEAGMLEDKPMAAAA